MPGLPREGQRQGQRERWRTLIYTKGKGKASNGKFGGCRGGAPGASKDGGYKDSAGHAVQFDRSCQHVDAESLASTRKMHNAEEVEDNFWKKKREKPEECGPLRRWR